MEKHLAHAVDLFADLDYGEGGISFRWPDPLYGEEELNINLDGFCSRAMPFYSGDDSVEAVELQRDRICFRFSDSLARKLRFEQEVEIIFTISDVDFRKLRQVINHIYGSGDDDAGE